jgi:hypothetical protein
MSNKNQTNNANNNRMSNNNNNNNNIESAKYEVVVLKHELDDTAKDISYSIFYEIEKLNTKRNYNFINSTQVVIENIAILTTLYFINNSSLNNNQQNYSKVENNETTSIGEPSLNGGTKSKAKKNLNLKNKKM